MSADGGQDKSQQYTNRRRQQAMIGRTEQEKFDEGPHAGDFPAKLPVSQPFAQKQGHPADEYKSQIKGGRMHRLIEKKNSQKYRCANLMNRPDQDGKVQDPIGPVTDPPHFIILARQSFPYLGHCSPGSSISDVAAHLPISRTYNQIDIHSQQPQKDKRSFPPHAKHTV
jgi:hypothetical protein